MAVISSILGILGSAGLAFGIGGGVITSGALAGTIIATTSSIIGGAIITGCVFGGIALSVLSSGKKSGIDFNSPSYQGLLQTQTSQELPLPLVYGTCKLAGNRIWQDENGEKTVKRIVAFSEGEITDFTDIRLNDIEANKVSGISINKYYGTANQVIDSIVGGNSENERCEKVGSLKNLAYLAISVPRSNKIDINYNLTTVVKGRKIRVYLSSNQYETKYSENPVWVMFDFLTAYNGLGLALNNDGTVNEDLVSKFFDLQSFIESASFCDELVNGSPRFTFNMVFDNQTSARSLMDEIYRSCRGGLFTKNGKLQFKIDKAVPVSKVFTTDDIVKGSEFFQTVPKEEHYDILKCVFISPKHEWQRVEAFAEIPEYRDGVPIEHCVNIFSVTNFEQASRLAWYYVNSKILQPYFGSFQTDYRAYDLEVGDVIRIDSLLMGLKNYSVKVTSVVDDGAGTFTVNWRNYDEKLYTDELGGKEPQVLVSSLSDVSSYPDDVKNFNVVQQQNFFNFVWEYNQSNSDTYEIRVGENFESGTVVGSKISENKFAYQIPTNGLYKFWIKGFNGYNYSKNSMLDVISVDSVPNVNEIIKIDVLDTMRGTFENALKYHGSIKLPSNDILWQNLEKPWAKDGYYQTDGYWGVNSVFQTGYYVSQVYDIGSVFESIVAFDYEYISADEQADVLIEWTLSEDGEKFGDWSIVNTGTYKFRFCKFRVTLRAYNNVQVVLTKLMVSVDVPDKELNLELEIKNPEGIIVDYDFVSVPSILGTVNDNINAYIVVKSKTNKQAVLEAFDNNGSPVKCKFSMRIRGY